ncbi:hypothetical protein J2S00_002396 [Caldalkalibacillus uzonensis]|uniref:Uncharacterized protein n=1 Tax=Caldalkalibacillus uzonensis TaxID=353224 RepID=A0ABU0CT63_9BACI|nr:hypothetical protein [Caldalkalibacillus uzonensis]MDQ0339608.1 hypothetical protein [Caldalkalibacillus uzonensis]
MKRLIIGILYLMGLLIIIISVAQYTMPKKVWVSTPLYSAQGQEEPTALVHALEGLTYAAYNGEESELNQLDEKKHEVLLAQLSYLADHQEPEAYLTRDAFYVLYVYRQWWQWYVDLVKGSVSVIIEEETVQPRKVYLTQTEVISEPIIRETDGNDCEEGRQRGMSAIEVQGPIFKVEFDSDSYELVQESKLSLQVEVEEQLTLKYDRGSLSFTLAERSTQVVISEVMAALFTIDPEIKLTYGTVELWNNRLEDEPTLEVFDFIPAAADDIVGRYKSRAIVRDVKMKAKHQQYDYSIYEPEGKGTVTRVPVHEVSKPFYVKLENHFTYDEHASESFYYTYWLNLKY